MPVSSLLAIILSFVGISAEDILSIVDIFLFDLKWRES